MAARTLFPTSTDAYAGTDGNTDYTFDTSSLGSQILRINYQEQNTDIKQVAAWTASSRSKTAARSASAWKHVR